MSEEEKDQDKQLTVRFDRRTVEMLGIRMYSGVVPALAELVANAWDADATEVTIDIPFEAAIDQMTITVKDNGIGMTFHEINNEFLVVGRNRRKEKGDLTPIFRRKVMGRKGIGKFAMLGIAHKIEIQTIKDGEIVVFEIDYNNLIENIDKQPNYEPYHPPINERGPTDKPQGTIVILKDLQIPNRPSEKVVKRSLTKRFSILGNNFKVILNGEELSPIKYEFKLRFPPEQNSWNEEDIPTVGKVRWWLGFCEKQVFESEMGFGSGIGIIVRGRMAEMPKNMLLSGAYGENGMLRLIGEIQADGLDEKEDYIATTRASIRWDALPGLFFREWIDKLLRKHLRLWAESLTQESVKTAFDDPLIKQSLLEVPREFQKEVRRLVKNYVSKQTPDENLLESTLEFTKTITITLKDVVLGEMLTEFNKEFEEFEHSNKGSDNYFKERAIAIEKFFEFIKRYDVVEAFRLARLVRFRARIAQTFLELIDKNTLENTIRDFVKEHPWVLRPNWIQMRGETSVGVLLREELSVAELPSYIEPLLRTDGVVHFQDGGDLLIVEFKRPNVSIRSDEVNQISNYVSKIQAAFNEPNDSKKKIVNVRGLIIGMDIDHPSRISIETNSKLDYTLWSQLQDETKAWYDRIIACLDRDATERSGYEIENEE